jgi:serine/threonine protein kinase/WD40 repeat protein
VLVEPEEDDCDPLDRLAGEFLEKLRRGERASISEFAGRAPGRSGELRDLLSALVMIESVKPGAGAIEGPARPPARHDSVAPQRVGDYRILREIGRGGMGVVYEAEQVSLGRRVALKILSPATSRSPMQVQRFLREARSAAQLHHSNIVPVFGVGEQDGLHYYAMQFIQGRGLDRVLDEIKHRRGLGDARRGAGPHRPSTAATEFLDRTADRTCDGSFAGWGGEPTPIPLPCDAPATHSGDDGRYAQGVATIGVQVAEALEYAHRQGMLHRDIKPSNLLLDLKGNAWVADFGLAKAVSDEDLTQTGDFVGTLRYMAPERFQGRGDARSDVHALGLTLYEMLALRPAFDAPDRDRLIYLMTLGEPPRLALLNRSTPRDLETIIHKAIERDPAHRYQTAGAMADDLRCFLEHRPIAARRAGAVERLTRWARRNPGLATLGTALAVLLAFTVVIVAVAALWLRRENLLVVANLERARNAEADAVGRLIESSLAHVRASRGNGQAGRRINGLRALSQVVGLDADGARRTDFRNEAIACLALTDLQRIMLRSTGGEDLADDLDPAGDRIARGFESGEIAIENVSGRRVHARLPGAGLPPAAVRFSNDGRFLAAKYARGERDYFAIHDLESGRLALRVEEGLHEQALDFHPDGRSFAAGRRDGAVVLYDLETMAEKARLEPGTIPFAIRFDPSGRWLAIVSPNSDQPVQVREVDGGRVVFSSAHPEGASAIDWRPEGRILAVGGEDGRIHLLDVDQPGRAPRLLEGHGGKVVQLVHQPSGDLLASASVDGTVRLWNVHTGRELARATVYRPFRLRFSNDGALLGPVDDGSALVAWKVIEGQGYRPLLKGKGRSSSVASAALLGDAGLIAAACDAGLRIAPAAPGKPELLAELPGTTAAAAAPDGSFLVSGGSWGLLRWGVSRSSGGGVRIGPPEPIGPEAGQKTQRLRLSRDGRTLAAALDDERGRALVVDLEGERTAVVLSGHPGLDRLDVSPDGARVATAARGGSEVKIWDARSGSVIVQIPASGAVDVRFSPDGSGLLLGDGGEYRLLETQGWSTAWRVAREWASGLAGEAAFRDDGRVLAVTRSRSVVLLLDPSSGRELATLESSDPRQITGLSFGGDGSLMVVSAGSETLGRWDLGAIRRELRGLGLDHPNLTPEGEPAAAAAPADFVVEPSCWFESYRKGEELARSGRWREAAEEFESAICSGAPGPAPWSRLAMCRVALGDASAYREACERLMAEPWGPSPNPSTANAVAWACALGDGGLPDYSRAIALAEAANAGRIELNRLNTLGAVLYRAGRLERAIEALDRSVRAHGAGGTLYDAFFLAMAHHRLGDRRKALEWLRRGSGPGPIAMRKPDSSGPSSWVPSVELRLLRREAERLIRPERPPGDPDEEFPIPGGLTSSTN